MTGFKFPRRSLSESPAAAAAGPEEGDSDGLSVTGRRGPPGRPGPALGPPAPDLRLRSGFESELRLRSGFEDSDLERPGRLPHQQGLCEARLGYRDRSPQLGPRDPS